MPVKIQCNSTTQFNRFKKNTEFRSIDPSIRGNGENYKKIAVRNENTLVVNNVAELIDNINDKTVKDERQKRYLL